MARVRVSSAPVSGAVRTYASHDRVARATVVALSGEHDVATVDAVVAALARADAEDVDVTVDLSAVTFLDAATVGALAHSCFEVRAHGHRFALHSPSAVARRTVVLCGLAEMIDDDPPPTPAPHALTSWVVVPAAPRLRRCDRAGTPPAGAANGT